MLRSKAAPDSSVSECKAMESFRIRLQLCNSRSNFGKTQDLAGCILDGFGSSTFDSHFRFVEDSGGGTSGRSRSEGRGAGDGKGSDGKSELHFGILVGF